MPEKAIGSTYCTCDFVKSNLKMIYLTDPKQEKKSFDLMSDSEKNTAIVYFYTVCKHRVAAATVLQHLSRLHLSSL